jgi:hypothetical protein
MMYAAFGMIESGEREEDLVARGVCWMAEVDLMSAGDVDL